jgi:hypothetical protein
MSFFRKRRPFKRDHNRPRPERNESAQPGQQEEADREAAYLKSLVESKTTVVVVLTSGEQLKGKIRYYDRDCFSLGPLSGGPKLFLRKSSVRYLYEE